ncbi:MAG: threonine ammonia-lyase [Gemmatimonadales bacterium]|nr:MAG: threonine ammonia-lyase [Gemmatimonadales bacterium]
MPTLADIQAARERVRDEIVLTPCTRSLVFDDLVDADLFFKFENLHRTGSFKERGALNRLLHLSDEERTRGVITASAGNHAQAVAYHARRLGVPATVVMPETTPLVKVQNTRRHGAQVILHGQRFSEAIEESKRLQVERELVMIHAYDDDLVIAGQGTLGLELAEQVPDVDVVIVPIGGGGIISGTAIALRALKPGVRFVGVEVEAAPSAWLSRQAGTIVEVETSETLADGIAVKRLGDRTFPIIEEHVEDIVVVGEEDIARAILLLLEREKTVVEGAGASPLAALLSGKVRVLPGEKVVAVLCGGNIDVNMISRIIDRGLVDDGRLARLRVTVRDRPGSLARLTALVAGAGANVLEVAHQREFADISVGDVEIVMHLETRGREHVDELLVKMRGTGVQVEEMAVPQRRPKNAPRG